MLPIQWAAEELRSNSDFMSLELRKVIISQRRKTDQKLLLTHMEPQPWFHDESCVHENLPAWSLFLTLSMGLLGLPCHVVVKI